MLKAIDRYARLSDKEWVEALTAPDADRRLQEYFFRTKCGNALRYISLRIYKSNDYSLLAGELYEFLADNNWSVLQKWEGRNGASLSGYISRCATNYFLQKEIAEKKRQENEVQASTPELLEQLASLADDYDDQSEIPPVWQSYNMLNKRDQEVLLLLVIEGKLMLSARVCTVRVASTVRSLVSGKERGTCRRRQWLCNMRPCAVRWTVWIRRQLRISGNILKKN